MVRTMFFNSENPNDEGYAASDFAKYFGTMVGDGIFQDDAREGLKVSPSHGTMKTVIAPGVIYIKGYMCAVDAPEELEHQVTTLAARMDYVVMRLDFTRDATENERSGSIYPTVTHEMVRTNDVYDMLLAVVTIPANQAIINNASITDRRGDEAVCGWAKLLGVTVDKELDAISQRINSLGATMDAGLNDVLQQVGLLAAETMKIEFGTYTGNGLDTRFITLGYQPLAILVLGNGFPEEAKTGPYARGGLALQGFPAVSKVEENQTQWNAVTIGTSSGNGGIWIHQNTNDRCFTNTLGVRYHYIIFRERG